MPTTGSATSTEAAASRLYCTLYRPWKKIRPSGTVFRPVDAVLVAGFPGQEAGHAVAAALLGDVEPAGRLVTCFPAADGAHPSWNVVPTDGVLTYDEGVFPGYRGYAAGRAPAPTYWLGHGLGYGTWEYGAPTLTASEPAPVLDVPVTNTGDHKSREVVQVYLDPADEDQPVRLVGWGSAAVPPGGTATVTVTCDARLWRRWDTAADRGGPSRRAGGCWWPAAWATSAPPSTCRDSPKLKADGPLAT